MIIAVISEKGGVGKTTTAVNLASALALSHEHVVVTDIDTQGDACFYDHEEGDLNVAWRMATPKTLASSLAREGLEARSSDVDSWGILDCPAKMGPATVAAFKVASMVLVPFDCRKGGRDGLIRIRDSVRMARLAENPTLRMRIVLTMWQHRSTWQQPSIDIVDGWFGPDVLSTRIRHSRLFETAAECRVPIVRLLPRSSGAQDYRQLAEEITSLCQ